MATSSFLVRFQMFCQKNVRLYFGFSQMQDACQNRLFTYLVDTRDSNKLSKEYAATLGTFSTLDCYQCYLAEIYNGNIRVAPGRGLTNSARINT